MDLLHGRLAGPAGRVLRLGRHHRVQCQPAACNSACQTHRPTHQHSTGARVVHRADAHQDSVFRVSFAGSTLVTCSADSFLKVWCSITPIARYWFTIAQGAAGRGAGGAAEGQDRPLLRLACMRVDSGISHSGRHVAAHVLRSAGHAHWPQPAHCRCAQRPAGLLHQSGMIAAQSKYCR